MCGCGMLRHHCTHGGELLPRLLSGIFCVQHPGGPVGKRRAVRPDLPHKVAPRRKCDLPLGKLLLKLRPVAAGTVRPSMPSTPPCGSFSFRYSRMVGTPSSPDFAV